MITILSTLNYSTIKDQLIQHITR